jgi:hypothetical protein
VPEAEVYVYHQYSGSFSQYNTIGPLYTNNNGELSVIVQNAEPTPKQLDCRIWINASRGGDVKKRTVIANDHASMIELKLDIYPVHFYVRDQSGFPLENATVSVGFESRETDKNGHALFYSKKGEFDYLISYFDGSQSGSLDIANDTSYGEVMPSYSITIYVVDDMGDPLNASIILADVTTQLGSDGKFSKSKTFGSAVEFTAIYGGITKNLKMYPAVDPNKQVVFDLTSPVIKEISKEEVDRKVRLTIPVEDKGKFPSGVDTSSILVTYRLEPAGETAQWSNAITYVSSKNVFIADFPEFNPDSLVQFRVEVADKEGNKAVVSGRFTTFTAQEPTNGTNSPPEPKDDEEFPIYYVIGGILLMVLIVYMFFRMKGKSENDQQI